MEELETFNKLKIGIASDEKIREWSKGEVKKPETINYRLAAPVAHIWYFKGIPSRIALMLDISPRNLERVVYFALYIVIDKGTSGLEKYQCLTEKEYHEAIEKYGKGSFKAGMGAEALKTLLEEIDLEKLAKSLRKELENASEQKKAKIVKRLDTVESFRISGNKPEWMIMNVVPVIPPDLRPMVQLDGGRFATTDLNDLYRRVINRNNRLKRLLELEAPEIIVRNEKRMLQESVDALIDNSRRGRPVTGAGGRALKSLSDLLKGKQGRFRQNLLGKRVDYSGRSVIVVGPELKIYQCGVPKEMAVELFKPFVMKELVARGMAHNIKNAKRMVERLKPEVWGILEDVIKDHPVMLNRAPTLHRLGIQAFEPVLVEGRAIKLHPLVCTAFNADFDGDQMAIHLPLSPEAQAEARYLMLSTNNLLKPQDGKTVTVPTIDMVFGGYYLTMEVPGEIGEGKYFKDPEEAIMAYENHAVGMHAKIYVRRTLEIDGEKKSKRIETTVGRILYNEGIPQDLGYKDRTNPEEMFQYEIDFAVNQKKLGAIIDNCIRVHGLAVSAELLDNIKDKGFKYCTRSGLTYSMGDVKVPEDKPQILAEADAKVADIRKKYRRGLITENERYKEVVNIWNEATIKVGKSLEDSIEDQNPINLMVKSGARGNINQLRQAAAMRGLMAGTTGKVIEIPIKSCFAEGLDSLEYFISSHQARKGLADTALRTADSGYLTRRLVDVAQEIIVREEDCGSKEGLVVYDIKDGNQLIEQMQERLIGRYPVNDIINPKTNEIIVDTNTLITEEIAEEIVNAGIEKAEVRSVLGCYSKHGVCQKCYGMSLARHHRVEIGETIGIVAAQSIGEPGTQLTMNTKHAAGAIGTDITQGLPRVEELFEARKPKGLATITEIAGKVKVKESKKKKEVIITSDTDSKTYTIPFGPKMKVKDGDMVEPGDPLVEGSLNPADILAIKGPEGVFEYLTTEVQKVYRNQGVDINDKHIEVIVRQMLKRVRVEDNGDTDMFPGTLVDMYEFADKNAEVVEKGLRPATGRRVLLGITKASLATDSFLSAASFQETTRILTEAAIKGKEDDLVGLKENVIIGKLIPAGTGMKKYQDLHISTEKKNEESVEA